MPLLRCGLLGTGLWLAGCSSLSVEEAPNVCFADPFPAYASDLTAFLPQHQGTYRLLGDTTLQFIVGEHTVWRQRVEYIAMTRSKYDAQVGVAKVTLGSRVVRGVFSYRVRQLNADSARLEMSIPDTLFDLHKMPTAKLRHWLGSYYLSTPTAGCWRVRRLLLGGRRLQWQAPSPDTLRRVELPASIIHLTQKARGHQWQVHPGALPQAQQVARYEGFWIGKGVFERR